MKNFTSLTIIPFLLFLCIIFEQPVHAQEAGPVEDKTASPYFFVKSEDGAVDQLPLKQTTADVKISGVIADVTVKQMYCNVGQKTLEAIYVFPASTKAAVYYMQMELGGRILKAEIRESEQARQDYEDAKNEGKTTSLLEQKRPNVFQMNVANILPGDTIEIEMRYTELLTPVEGVYEFVYPTVVGPRYAELSTEVDSSWVEVPYTHEGEEPLYDFEIDVKINAGMEIQEIMSPSHTAQFNYISPNSVICTLPDEETKTGNKDFVLHYVLSGDGLESGILLYEGKEENFFLLMVQPPKAPLPTDIPPREYVFIMDVSGSMNGFPIGVSKAVLTDLISNLKPSDKFNVICFAGGAQVMSEASLDATRANIEKAIETIDNKEGGGGTNMLLALNKALALPGTENYARTFVIVTDGYVTIEKEAFDLIRNNLSEANFFAFGIGSSVNRYLIEGIAHAGMGEPFIVLNEDEAPENAEKFRSYIETPVLTNIEIDFGNFNVYDIEPLKVPDVFAERPVITFGKWNGAPLGTIKISGLNGNHSYHNEIQVSETSPSPENSALKYLWARYVVQRLDDYGKADNSGEDDGYLKEIITELGLKYNLLTRYTSFIAIDSLIRNNGDSITTVTQPLPLPAGVSDYAVGGSYPLGFGGPATSYALDLGGKNSTEQEPSSYIDKIYPNPAVSKFKVWIHIDEKDKLSDKKLYLLDHSGHILKIITIENSVDSYISVKVNFDETGYFPSGIYKIALLLNGNATNYKNIIITH
jgi:Ca-activated chloride channel family protein